MSLLLPLSSIDLDAAARVGGKAVNLARLKNADLPVPRSFCLPTEHYKNHLRETGLDAMIDMELGRKDLDGMRWEEIWDAALRIRNLFNRIPLAARRRDELRAELVELFGDRPVVVRSSAPAEDSAKASFAGLHESVVNLRGPEQIIDAILLVWASLWSDRALLYRQELQLDPRQSSMAVIIQELIDSEKSGVAFSRNPNNPQQAVIEAVWGLNQGLVDGSIAPDQWLFERSSGQLQLHQPAERLEQMRPDKSGVCLQPLDQLRSSFPPLSESEAQQVFALAMRLEALYAAPQDCEWTYTEGALILLQCRPITRSPAADQDDPRSGFLNLHRSFSELVKLREKIELQLLPAMEEDAARLALFDLQKTDNRQLAREVEQRRKLMADWEAAYVEYCIPMAHGVRLFAEFYNDRIKPENPFSFVELLSEPGFRAIERNQRLRNLARELLAKPAGEEQQLKNQLARIRREFALPELADEMLLQLLRQYAARPVSDESGAKERERLAEDYFAHFPAAEQPLANDLLELARASYRLRDDDNISMGKVRQQLQAAEAEAKRRLQSAADPDLGPLFADEPAEQFHPASRDRPQADPQLLDTQLGSLSFRQLQGQPAGPGVASGPARVLRDENDLWQVKQGEILVCDAIDPAMTFVVPLVSGIVERRGGMLIHGAIIAREYRIPCVTGVVDAAERIKTGDRVTVDGYLGIITLARTTGG